MHLKYTEEVEGEKRTEALCCCLLELINETDLLGLFTFFFFSRPLSSKWSAASPANFAGRGKGFAIQCGAQLLYFMFFELKL